MIPSGVATLVIAFSIEPSLPRVISFEIVLVLVPSVTVNSTVAILPANVTDEIVILPAELASEVRDESISQLVTSISSALIASDGALSRSNDVLTSKLAAIAVFHSSFALVDGNVIVALTSSVSVPSVRVTITSTWLSNGFSVHAGSIDT